MEEQSGKGMTVNERLVHFSLFEWFDAAARTKDVLALLQVLLRAEFTDEQALQIAEAVAANPKRDSF